MVRWKMRGILTERKSRAPQRPAKKRENKKHDKTELDELHRVLHSKVKIHVRQEMSSLKKTTHLLLLSSPSDEVRKSAVDTSKKSGQRALIPSQTSGTFEKPRLVGHRCCRFHSFVLRDRDCVFQMDSQPIRSGLLRGLKNSFYSFLMCQ